MCLLLNYLLLCHDILPFPGRKLGKRPAFQFLQSLPMRFLRVPAGIQSAQVKQALGVVLS